MEGSAGSFEECSICYKEYCFSSFLFSFSPFTILCILSFLFYSLMSPEPSEMFFNISLFSGRIKSLNSDKRKYFFNELFIFHAKNVRLRYITYWTALICDRLSSSITLRQLVKNERCCTKSTAGFTLLVSHVNVNRQLTCSEQMPVGWILQTGFKILKV